MSIYNKNLGPLRVTQPTTQKLAGIVNSLLTRKKYNKPVGDWFAR